ncbi:hypothetical protein [Pseudomonas phage vB_Pa-PAC8]|nr:hypothetical protein [Pseudomonas phage PhL_UNISO_PA-DSM_ph0031]
MSILHTTYMLVGASTSVFVRPGRLVCRRKGSEP